MLGAIIGDIVGSIYEFHNLKSTNFPLFQEGCRFTDDTVLTVAIADSILSGVSYGDNLKKFYYLYPQAGYGARFEEWAQGEGQQPYHSWGNGSAMRVSAIGFAFDTLDEVLLEAKRSAEVTHNHPEGIKGAQAIAASILLARQGRSKAELKQFIEQSFQYGLDTPLAHIRPHYTFDVSCQGSVPWAIRAFLESNSLEEAIRLAISIGGDSDTMACMAGGIAQAFYQEISQEIVAEIKKYLDGTLNSVVEQFCQQFNIIY